MSLSFPQEVVQSVRVHPWDPLQELGGHEAFEIFVILLVSTLLIAVAKFACSGNLLQIRIAVLILCQILETAEDFCRMLGGPRPNDLQLFKMDCQQRQL